MDHIKHSLVFLFLHMASFSYAQKENFFFREDYTYLDDTQNFYKIHTVGRNFDDAYDRCELEGASLFYPKTNYEASAVLDLWERTHRELQSVTIGITLISEGNFETIHGQPISTVYDNWAPGEPNNAFPGEECVEMKQQNGTLNDVVCGQPRPFICRKSLASLRWNYQCNMPNTDYKFESSVGNCYKFHLQPKTWSEAYAVCSAEQSYLAIINSQEEADVLARITAEAPKDSVEGNYLRGAVHLGFLKTSRGWVTIRGRKLENSGYSKWGYGQPDNAGGNEVCGSMFYNGQLNDINCDIKMFFICEHDVPQTL